MRIRLSSLASLALASGACLLNAPSAGAEMTAGQIIALIPKDQTIAEVLVPEVPARLVELTRAIRVAAWKDSAWWNEYRTSASEGEPLPYDEKLGISKEDYEEYLSLASKRSLVKTGEVTLSVASDDDKTFEISCDDTLATIDGVRLDLTSDKVDTPFGSAAERLDIEASPKQSLTGPWSGVEWKFIEIKDNKATGTMVQFALGRLEETGRGILYYKGSRAAGMPHGSNPHGGDSSEKVTLILTYPLADAE